MFETPNFKKIREKSTFLNNDKNNEKNNDKNNVIVISIIIDI